MKKIIILTLSVFLFYFKSNGQIEKGNWMIGGDASFTSYKTEIENEAKGTQNVFQLSPDAGYFIADKFSTGIIINSSLIKGKIGNGTTTKSNTYNFGPFVRYYFLPTENIVNLFVEGVYEYGIIHQKTPYVSNDNSNTFLIAAGPVLYFNTAVGLEFTVGYAFIKWPNYAGRNTNVQMNLGFQFYLNNDH